MSNPNKEYQNHIWHITSREKITECARAWTVQESATQIHAGTIPEITYPTKPIAAKGTPISKIITTAIVRNHEPSFI